MPPATKCDRVSSVARSGCMACRHTVGPALDREGDSSAGWLEEVGSL